MRHKFTVLPGRIITMDGKEIITITRPKRQNLSPYAADRMVQRICDLLNEHGTGTALEPAFGWVYVTREDGGASKGEIAPGVFAEDYNGVYAYCRQNKDLYVISGSAIGQNRFMLLKNRLIIKGGNAGIFRHELGDVLAELELPPLTKYLE